MIAAVLLANAHRSIERMRRALDEFYVRGVSHNVRSGAPHGTSRFREEAHHHFIAEEFKGGFTRRICRRAIRRCWPASPPWLSAFRDTRVSGGGQPRRHAQPRADWHFPCQVARRRSPSLPANAVWRSN